MDLKQKKPIHLRCPKCGHDFACNTNRIEEDYHIAKNKAANLKAKLAELNDKNISKNAPEYKRLKRLHEDAIAQIVAIKKVRQALNREMEIQKYNIFKKLVKGIIGEQKTIELLKEAEDEMAFREYDMAIQKNNRFNGV